MSQLTTAQIDFINQKTKDIKYGEIRIIINENAKFLDIVVEERERFAKENKVGVEKPSFKRG